MRIDVRKGVSKLPGRKYREYSLEYKIVVAEIVLAKGYRGLLGWKEPPPRSSAYRWARVAETEGYSGLRPKSRRPHVIHRADPELLSEAVWLRKEYGWNAKAISGYMRKNGKYIGETTIGKEIRRQGLVEPLQKPRKRHKYVRWERDHSNSLWQMDWAWVEDRRQWLLAILDDHSRFIVGARFYTEATTENALELLDEAIWHYSKPREILTDRGTQFFKAPTKQTNKTTVISRFTRELAARDIKHIVASPKSPQTCGKIERFFGTYKREAWRYPTLAQFIQYYNEIRPHQSLDYDTPVVIYFQDMPA